MRTRVILSLAILGLASSAALAQSRVTATDLQHHRWMLESIDGEALPDVNGKGKIPELDFGEQMHVSGNLGCNRFNGKAVLRDGYFLVEAMTSTRMMCAGPWGDIELKLTTALGSESTASLDKDRNLTLVAVNGTYKFRLQDWVASAVNIGDEVPRGFSARGSRSGYTDKPPPFGGRTSPEGEMDEADIDVDPAFRFPEVDELFAPREAWKKCQNKENGLQFSAHYSTMYQAIGDSIGTEDDSVLVGGIRYRFNL